MANTGATSYQSGLNVFQPLCYTRTPNGDLIAVNGVDRGLFWDFATTYTESLGIDKPTTAPTLADDTGGGSVTASGVYYGYYRYLDKRDWKSSLSPATKLTTDASSNHRLDWSALAVPTDIRPDRLQLVRNTSGQATTLYHVTLLGVGGAELGVILTSETYSGKVKFVTYQTHNLPVGAVISVTGHHDSGAAPLYVTTHTVTRVLSEKSFVTDINYTADGTEGHWTPTGYVDDSRADSEVNTGGGAIASSATDGGAVKYTTSRPHGLIVGQTVAISEHSVVGYNSAAQKVASCLSSTEFTTDKTWTANGTGGTWTHELEYALPILNPDDSVSLNRFTPPPNYKAVVAMFQDRAFYAVDVEYDAGYVGTIAGSATVNGGGGANWTSTMAGRYFYKIGDDRSYLIASATATTMTLATPYLGYTSVAVDYVIRPAASELNQIYFSEVLEPESVISSNTIKLQNNTGEEDELVGLMPSASTLYALQKRHIYGINFFAQPTIDVSIRLLCSRGCLNNRCWVFVEDTPYLMDYHGVYRLNSETPESVSGPIQNIFRDGTIDFSQSKWFFASQDQTRELIFFHYCRAGETRPKHAIVLNYRTGQIWLEDYPWELGGAAHAAIENRFRLLWGGENEVTYLTGQGTLDATTGSGTTRGTATTATTTSITDTAATFPTDIVGAPVHIVAGTGKGQAVRFVSARNSATQFTVSSPFATTPDTTSVYQLGAIPYNYQTGLFPLTGEFDAKGQEVDRALRVVAQPTAGANTLDARLYYNHDTTPRPQRPGKNYGDGAQVLEADTQSIVLDLKQDRSGLAAATGLWQWALPGRIDQRSTGGDRWISLQLTGYQGDDPIQLLAAELAGAASSDE